MIAYINNLARVWLLIWPNLKCSKVTKKILCDTKPNAMLKEICCVKVKTKKRCKMYKYSINISMIEAYLSI